MSGIRGRDTKPELTVRRFLHSHGLRYRVHVRELPGRPDIVLPGKHAVVFVNGCFWHKHPGCRFAYAPATNTDFWADKLSQNVERDERTNATLRARGWTVHTVWECELSDARLHLLARELGA